MRISTYIIETRAIGVGGGYRPLCYVDATNELHAIDIVYHDVLPSLRQDNKGKCGKLTPLYVYPSTEARAVLTYKENVYGVLPEYTRVGFVYHNDKNIGEI